MHTCPWKGSVILMITFLWLIGQTTSFCNDSIIMKCTSDLYQAIIMNINASTDIAQKVLEQCSARQECHVPYTSQECITPIFWCRKKVQMFEITASSDINMNADLSLFSIMSKGYMKGHKINASVINCALKFTDQAKSSNKGQHIMRYTKTVVHEMAPFTNSTDYCFYLNENAEPLICSGSETIHTSYGPFNSTNELKFRMQLTNASYVPQIRFWIEIDVSPKDGSMHLLECDSHPDVIGKTLHKSLEVTEQTDAEMTFSGSYISITTANSREITFEVQLAIILPTAILGTLLLFGLLALCFRAPLMCRKTTLAFAGKGPTDRSSHVADEHDYTYIDLDHLGIPGQMLRRESSIPSLSSSEPVTVFAGSNFKNRDLPLPPREVLDAQDEQEKTKSPHAVCDSDAGDYLRPSIPAIGDDGIPAKRDKLASNATNIDQVDLNKGDKLNLQDEDENSEDRSQEHTKNEYIGLDKETRSEEDNISRSSSGILYTLLDGIPRAAGTHQEDENGYLVLLSGDIQAKSKGAEEKMQKGGNENGAQMKLGGASPMQGDKDEHGYLVLLSGDIQTKSINTKDKNKSTVSENGAEVNLGASPMQGDKDEHGYLVLHSGDILAKPKM